MFFHFVLDFNLNAVLKVLALDVLRVHNKLVLGIVHAVPIVVFYSTDANLKTEDRLKTTTP